MKLSGSRGASFTQTRYCGNGNVLRNYPEVEHFIEITGNKQPLSRFY